MKPSEWADLTFLSRYLFQRKVQKKVDNLTVFLPQQSSDKNLMVPVGGAIVAGSDQRVVQAVASSYPGRSDPVLLCC